MKNVKVYTRKARVLKLVASATRTGILLTLDKNKKLPVQEIAGEMGMTHSAISHQLAVLSGAGIVDSKKDGRLMVYWVAKNGLAKSLVATIKKI